MSKMSLLAKGHSLKRAIYFAFILFVFANSTLAQGNKPWTEWTMKDVEKTLSNSAWSQTQTEGGAPAQPQNTSAITATTAARREDSNITAASRVESGEVNSATVKYHVRFLSAKPVRAAFARLVQLKQSPPNASLTAQLQGFVNRDFSEWIVISVGVEVKDEKAAMALTRLFSIATTEKLQQNVYLERKDGKRLFLMEYRPPSEDGMGAKFIFQRVVDGQPFLSDNDGVRFFAQLNDKLKLSMKYKLSDMMFDGKLEY